MNLLLVSSKKSPGSAQRLMLLPLALHLCRDFVWFVYFLLMTFSVLLENTLKEKIHWRSDILCFLFSSVYMSLCSSLSLLLCVRLSICISVLLSMSLCLWAFISVFLLRLWLCRSPSSGKMPSAPSSLLSPPLSQLLLLLLLLKIIMMSDVNVHVFP